ncbi:MAG TPA: hypothetical protein EYM83_05975 [Nitrospirales bacterium]|nr:hypothetical protein [Nitrospirales bacterium]
MIHLINLSLVGVVLILGTNVTVALGLWVPATNFPLLLHQEVYIQTPQAAAPRYPHPPIVRVGTTQTNMPVLNRPSKDTYSVIVEKDLFHPTRKKHTVPKVAPRPLPKSTAQVKSPNPKKMLPRRSPTHPKRDKKKKRVERLALQGVVLFGDYQRALIADLLRKPRDPMDVGIGDTVGRYTVKEILEDRVILAAGETETRTLELMADDKLNRRSHVVTPTPHSSPTVGKPAKAKKAKKRSHK